MSEGAESLDIVTIEQAVSALSIAGIEFYELTARRAPQSDEDEDREANVQPETAFRLTDVGIDYRVRLDVTFGMGEIAVDGAVRYVTDGTRPFRITPEVLAGFGTNVAIMALFPYLRQAVSDLGSRIGLETTLPLLSRGQLTLEVPEDLVDDPEPVSD